MTIREIETELEKLRNELMKHHQVAREAKVAAKEAKNADEYYQHFERTVILDSAIANLKPVLAELSRIA